jgi:hypothetical protein
MGKAFELLGGLSGSNFSMAFLQSRLVFIKGIYSRYRRTSVFASEENLNRTVNPDWNLIPVFSNRNYGFRRSHESGMIIRHQEITRHFGEISRVGCWSNQEA